MTSHHQIRVICYSKFEHSIQIKLIYPIITIYISYIITLSCF